MISFIEGRIEHATPLEVILNCHGLGYRVEIPVTTAEKLPGMGQTVRLHTCPVYREDSQALYGFSTVEERDFFQLVTGKVSGIGPKIGLNLMSRLSFPMLRQAIARSDVALLAKCPGIGKKTAERICIELKDKVGLTNDSSPGSVSSTISDAAVGSTGYSDAVQALMTLGYKLDAADNAIRKACKELGSDASADALIKAALKSA